MLALSPLIFFIIIYLATSLVAGDFYKVPISVAFLFTAIFAIAVSRGKLNHRIRVFNRGAGRKNMMLMIWIFILAGAFANSAKQMGSVDSFVNLTLSIVPSNAIMVGLFLASALISLSIGTSVGTIVALVPIATGIADSINGTDTTLSSPLQLSWIARQELSTLNMVGIVVGGAFFGDNLSFISDTTVVATQTQGCSMKDKFRTNIYIALPAAFVIMGLYGVMGLDVTSSSSPHIDNIAKVIPYIVVLATAIMGVNVLVVLTVGIILCGLVGLYTGSYIDMFEWYKAMGDGVLAMGELIIVTLLAGGILETIRANGGIRFVINKLLKHVHSARGAELSIAAMVSMVDICTANNTVAIITVAGISRDISQRFNLDPRRVSSILDTFSCVMQGLIPYGAQLLMAAALAHCNPVSIIPYLYYPYALLFMAVLAIIFRFPRLKTNSTS